ncbi:MAG: hypothetical protein LBE59_02360, partial [Nevskiaceae bacterium]|nr:hypothetical protein [Nevskiaceae bacterium]
EMASDIAAVRVFLLYGIDPLQSVPLEQFRTSPMLHKTRWPQIVEAATVKRQGLKKLALGKQRLEKSAPQT